MRLQAQAVDPDPRGRLDILAYRILERLGKRHAPREWPVLQGITRELTDQLGPRPRRQRRRRK